MANCKECKDKRATEIIAPENVPYIVHEAAMARNERNVKRLVIALVVAIVLAFATNVGWLIYESQFEVVQDTTITQENENGYNNYIGNDGDINYGKTNDKN